MLVVTSECWGNPGVGSRGDGGMLTAKGIGFACWPQTPVVSPCSAMVTERVLPIGSDARFTGLILRPEDDGDAIVRMFFLTPKRGIVGKSVRRGEYLGTAQDIRAAFPEAVMPFIYMDAWLGGRSADILKLFGPNGNG